MSDISSTIALVTGANRGIGLEVAHQLAQAGMTVILGSRDLQESEAAAAPLIKAGLSLLPRQLDGNQAPVSQSGTGSVEQVSVNTAFEGAEMMPIRGYASES